MNLTEEEKKLDEERRLLAEGPLVEDKAKPSDSPLRGRHALCEVCQGEGILFERVSFWCPACLGRGGNDPGMVRAARDFHRGYYTVIDREALERCAEEQKEA